MQVVNSKRIFGVNRKLAFGQKTLLLDPKTTVYQFSPKDEIANS